MGTRAYTQIFFLTGLTLTLACEDLDPKLIQEIANEQLRFATVNNDQVADLENFSQKNSDENTEEHILKSEDQSTEENCADGIDNDGDEKTDCNDEIDCEGKPCNDNLACSFGDTCLSGNCLANTSDCVELTCDDGIDNDLDTLVDCEDPDCDGLPCNDEKECSKNDFCFQKTCEGIPQCVDN